MLNTKMQHIFPLNLKLYIEKIKWNANENWTASCCPFASVLFFIAICGFRWITTLLSSSRSIQIYFWKKSSLQVSVISTFKIKHCTALHSLLLFGLCPNEPLHSVDLLCLLLIPSGLFGGVGLPRFFLFCSSCKCYGFLLTAFSTWMVVLYKPSITYLPIFKIL